MSTGAGSRGVGGKGADLRRSESAKDGESKVDWIDFILKLWITQIFNLQLVSLYQITSSNILFRFVETVVGRGATQSYLLEGGVGWAWGRASWCVINQLFQI